jgi:hypothetical protein
MASQPLGGQSHEFSKPESRLLNMLAQGSGRDASVDC